jgi:hypothetical protein
MTDRLIVIRGYIKLKAYQGRSKDNKAHDFVIGEPNLKSKPD